MDYAGEYGRLHARGKYFPGLSILPYVKNITRLVAEHMPERMLDYGCGRGIQYLNRRVHEKWGGPLPHCYDVAVNGLQELPDGPFGGVLCIDVLEHIERADLGEVLQQLVRLTGPGGFLFLVISCRPTRKKLPDGRDVHVTIEPPSWWQKQILRAVSDRIGIHVVAHFDVAGHFDEPEDVWDLVR